MKKSELKQLIGKSIWELNEEKNIDISSEGLSSLKGMPEIVSGDFYCNHNNLTSLTEAFKSKRVKELYNTFSKYYTKKKSNYSF